MTGFETVSAPSASGDGRKPVRRTLVSVYDKTGLPELAKGLHDAGVAIVPHGTITQEVAKQTLVEVKIEDAEVYRPLAAIYKKTKVLSPAIKQFLAILKT